MVIMQSIVFAYSFAWQQDIAKQVSWILFYQ